MNKVGRPKILDGSKKYFKIIGLTLDQWVWLQQWHPGNPTMQAQSLVETAIKFWPSGAKCKKSKRG
jgi:hypothetical protein